MIVALVVVTGLLCLVSASFLQRSMRLGLRIASALPDAPIDGPKTAVIVPCRGDGKGRLEQRLSAILAQSYRNAEFLFVTDAESDPAYAVFKKLETEHPERAVRCIVAPGAERCSQKNSNLIAAIDAAAADTEVFVFLDSDGLAPSGLVAALIGALQRSPNAPAATGFRWYGAHGTLSSALRSTWNAGGIGFMLDPNTRFIWGGAMAFRRATVLSQVRPVWERTLSDDLGLSRWLKAQPEAPQFAPDAIMWSEEDDTLWSLLRWTTRQTYVTRIYDRVFFGAGLVTHALGWSLFSAGIALGGTGFVASALWVGHLPFAYAASLGAFSAILARSKWTLGAGSKIALVVLSPVASLMLLCNSLGALCMRSYSWAGIRYRVRGPLEISVER